MTPILNQLSDVIQNGLCHRCGSCSGICPRAVINPAADYYPTWVGREADCTNCGLCVKACPGRAFSFPDYTQSLHNRDASALADHGRYLKAFLGYSADPAIRDASTSGGLATQIPRFFLESGRAKGALAARPDPLNPWKPQAFIARNLDDLRPAMLSKYAACSMNHLFRQIRAEDGPFVLTGLPCHIHGMRRMGTLQPNLDRKIALSIGLFCHSCLDHSALLDILAIYRQPENELATFTYRSGKLPGYIHATTRDGRQINLPYPSLPADAYRPNAKECLTLFFKFYSPPRCRLCIDATSEFSDITLGDPWVKGWQGVSRLTSGYNLVIARTARGLDALHAARDSGAIVLEDLPDSLRLNGESPMVRNKRHRGLYNIDRLIRNGRPAPEYGLPLRLPFSTRFRTALHVATYFAADRPALRRPIVAFLLSAAGRLVVAAAFFRRRVLHAAREQAKTRLSGRSVADQETTP